jgi:molybdopterin-guanine dinucleotide biosynthesis protein A
LICRVAERLRPLADGCIVVANQAAVCAAVAPLMATCLPDAYPDAGPLGGLATGLAHIDGWAICVACDMPFVQPALFRFLLGIALEKDATGQDRWDAVVPYALDRPQPLHALYHPRCLFPMAARLLAGQRRMDGFLAAVRVHWVKEEEIRRVDPTLSSFFNANTVEDWHEALRQMENE